MASQIPERPCSRRPTRIVGAILVVAMSLAACQAPTGAGTSLAPDLAPTPSPSAPAASATPSPAPRPATPAEGLGPVDIAAIDLCALLPETSIEATLGIGVTLRSSAFGEAPLCRYVLSDDSVVATRVVENIGTPDGWDEILQNLTAAGADVVMGSQGLSWTRVHPEFVWSVDATVRAVEATVVTEPVVLTVILAGVPGSDGDLTDAALVLVDELRETLEATGIPRMKPTPGPSLGPTPAPATGRCDVRLRSWIADITDGLGDLASTVEQVPDMEVDAGMFVLMAIGQEVIARRAEFRASVPAGGSLWPGIERYGRWIERTADAWFEILEGSGPISDAQIGAALGGFDEIEAIVADVADEADGCP